MNMKKITSLVMLWAMILMTYTGIVLFIAPHGRVANWTNWTLLGWNKDQFAQVHTTFMVLFIVGTILHIYYNWKPLANYMSDKVKKFVFFTKDMIAALAITLLFLFGTLYYVTPFSTFINFGETIKDSWIEKKDEPPFGHAEELTLEDFSAKMGYNISKVIEVLAQNKIKTDSKVTLEQIAAEYNKTAGEIFELLTKSLGNTQENKITGLGRKSFKQIADDLQMPVEKFLTKLETMGIKAKPQDKFRTTLEEQGFNARDVIAEF